MAALKLQFLERLADIAADEWNGLVGTEYPFLRHEYLNAMEASRSVCARTGWHPCHLVARDDEGLAAAMPLYEKNHSWGEYVFDWVWAEAYERHGEPYYPKLVTAIPFTPCEGARLVLRELHDVAALETIVDAVQERAQQQGCSSWHMLFPCQDTQTQLAAPSYAADHNLLQSRSLLKRAGVQFHWRNPGCTTFTEFLELFASRKRKNIRKERESVAAQQIHFRWLDGPEISASLLDQFYLFYQATYLKRGQQGYLTKSFFERMVQDMPEQVMLILAEHHGRAVAAAWFFKNSTTLYGRYWGCLEEFDRLHFETCYYQGIDYCLAHGLQYFDAGAQGEHKLLRGFAPKFTASYHWIADERFRPAVSSFLEREQRHVQEYLSEAASVLPYRKDLTDAL